MRRANLCNKMEHMRHKALHNTLVTVNAPLHPPLKCSLLSLEYRQTWRIIFGEILLRRYTRLEFLDSHEFSLSLCLSLSRLKHDALPATTALASLVY